MPLIDMSLEKLKEYQGINPCPHDIDEYWDIALEEMRNTDSQVELVKSSFKAPGAECFDLYFTGVGGSRIHAKYLRPINSKEPHPAVLQFHGYTGSAGEWNDKLAYVNAGFSVAAMDCRGQGGSSEDKGSYEGSTLRGHITRGLHGSPVNLLFRHVYLDTAQLASIVMNMPEVDENRVGAMGGSQGGGLTIACAALEPRIKRLAPIYPFLTDYRRVWNMDLAKGAYEDLGYYFRKFDPLHEKEDEIFTKLGYIDLQHIAKRIKGEVLMAVGLMDTTCPPSSQFATYNKITAPKELAIYPDYGHESLPGFMDRTYEFIMGL